MSDEDVYKIKPAGRHLNTIGRDLIHDNYAAIVELVKNAWDADSPDVSIVFCEKKGGGYIITVEDHGHGMNRDVVLNHWMVPSTDDKKIRKKSPGKRDMQGNKGIGRYAASILGHDLLLETTTSEREYTTLLLQWSDFEKADFLEDVDVLVETKKGNYPCGTRLTINSNDDFQEEWNKKQLNRLRFELKKLMTPRESLLEETEDKVEGFKIFLTIRELESRDTLFEKEILSSEEIQPYPIVKLYDYRISGYISKSGEGKLTYYLQKNMNNTVHNEISLNNNEPTRCGNLFFDIRVYDREKEAIESLIRKGLKDERDNYVGKNDARKLLNDSNGIGVYRNGFRIRPLGDPDFDWLELNKKRIQNPSMRIGSNQVIGYVQIESEEQSNLIEKSARDGLKKNRAFIRLQDISSQIIGLLEERRFRYRKNEGLSRPALKIEKEFERLFSSEELKKEINTTLKKGKVNKETSDEVLGIIEKDTDSRNKILEDIRKSVAVYQGQATLGKIINAILHEGRKPLNYFRNQIPNLEFWRQSMLDYFDDSKFKKITEILKGIGDNADIFVKLFSKLDPLASGRRDKKKTCSLLKEISKAAKVFEGEFAENSIEIFFEGDNDFQYEIYEQDIYVIFTNLMDNSIYWLSSSISNEKRISIKLYSENRELLHIDYSDTGPGIAKEYIEKELIFEPQFSTKPQGTGLGLPIAGEAAARMDWEIKALGSELGACFRIQEKGEDEYGKV